MTRINKQPNLPTDQNHDHGDSHPFPYIVEEESAILACLCQQTKGQQHDVPSQTKYWNVTFIRKQDGSPTDNILTRIYLDEISHGNHLEIILLFKRNVI